LAWIPFRVSNFDDMIYSMQKYVIIDFDFTNVIPFINGHKILFFLIVMFVAFNYYSYKKKELPSIISNLKLRYWFFFLTSIMLAIFLFYNGNPEDFIYFQF